MKARPSMEKRRKEQARKERRLEKAERRERRKAERAQQREGGPGADDSVLPPAVTEPEAPEEAEGTS